MIELIKYMIVPPTIMPKINMYVLDLIKHISFMKIKVIYLNLFIYIKP